MAQYYILKNTTGNTQVKTINTYGKVMELQLPIGEAEKLLRAWYNGEQRFLANGVNCVTGIDLSQVQQLTIDGLTAKFKSNRTPEEKAAQAELIERGNAYLESRKAVEEVAGTEEIQPTEESVRENDDIDPTAQEYMAFEIDCKCGTKYVARMFNDTTRAKCRECGDRVFADFEKEPVETDRGLAQVMTNKYYVQQPKGGY